MVTSMFPVRNAGRGRERSRPANEDRGEPLGLTAWAGHGSPLGAKEVAGDDQ